MLTILEVLEDRRDEFKDKLWTQAQSLQKKLQVHISHNDKSGCASINK